MSVRDDKRTEEVKLRLTEREMLDASRLAAIDERSLAEWIVRELRRGMYGSLAARSLTTQGPERAEEGR